MFTENFYKIQVTKIYNLFLLLSAQTCYQKWNSKCWKYHFRGPRTKKIPGACLGHPPFNNPIDPPLEHINEIIKKANKRFYFIVLLERANVNAKDIVNFYCTVIGPVLEYCAQVFHHSLSTFLSDDLEVVQKRALKIISPGQSYNQILDHFSLLTLFQRREEMCSKLFNNIIDSSHKLYHLLYLLNMRPCTILEATECLICFK